MSTEPAALRENWVRAKDDLDAWARVVAEAVVDHDPLLASYAERYRRARQAERAAWAAYQPEDPIHEGETDG